MKIIFSFIVTCFFATTILLGQETTQQHLELKVKIPDLLSTFNFTLEYVPNKHFGAEISAGIRTADSYIFSFDSDGRETDFFTLLVGKFYVIPRHDADRLYIGTYGLYEYDKNVVSFDQETFENRILIGGLVGYKFLMYQRLILDFIVGTGFGRQLTKSQITTGIIEVAQESLNFHTLVTFNLGFRF